MNSKSVNFASLNHNLSVSGVTFGRPFASGISNGSDQFRILTPLRSEAEHIEMIKGLKEKCIELTKLEKGWDGYNAVPVKIDNANFAMSIIDQLVNPQIYRPSIIPGYNGTVQIEWCENNYELEIEITKSDEVEVLLTDLKTDEMQEECLNLSSNEDFFEILSELVYKLRENREIPAHYKIAIHEKMLNNELNDENLNPRAMAAFAIHQFDSKFEKLFDDEDLATISSELCIGGLNSEIAKSINPLPYFKRNNFENQPISS